MDAQGRARSFPDPGAVLVDVSELSVEERALILFRHAKSAGLESEAKDLVRKYAAEIVHDPEFTPERMRRFVHESLPLIASDIRSEKISDSQVRSAVKEALRNPTKQMRLTFQKLPPAHKWFLVALLEIPIIKIERFGNVQNLQVLYEAYCPDRDHEPFKVVMDQLTEAFVKVRKSTWGSSMADWIHPSYRDLVIEELMQDSGLRNTFLRRASLEGVKLAVSDTGGRYGSRRMPLIRSAESWDVLQERCLSLITADAGDRDVLEVLANAASEDRSSGQRNRWEGLLALVCGAVQQKWDRMARLVPALDLEAFAKARSYARPAPALPNLLTTWNALDEVFLESLRVARMGRPLDYEAFDNLTSFARAVSQCAPEFLKEKSFPAKYETEIMAILIDTESEADNDPRTSDPDELRELAGRADSIASSVEHLADLSINHAPVAYELAERLRNHSSALEGMAAENEPPEPEGDEGYSRGEESAMTFDIALLFSEL